MLAVGEKRAKEGRLFEQLNVVKVSPFIYQSQCDSLFLPNDTVLGFNKSGKEVARIQVEEPIYIRPAERVTWL